jgi:hypothetical protein
VLPGNSLVIAGWSQLRQLAFEGTDSALVEARNKGGTLFDEVHHSYAVALLARGPVDDGREPSSRIWPGVTTLHALQTVAEVEPLSLSNRDLTELTPTWVVPWFNSRADPPVFDKIRVRGGISEAADRIGTLQRPNQTERVGKYS